MSYIGSTPASQFFAPGTDTFSGTGSQTAFTLSRNVATVNDILVIVNNVEQQPSNYTVSGSTLTFSPAPSSGTNNIYVRYLSTNLIAIVPSATGTANSTTFLRGDNTWAVVSVTPTAVSDQVNLSTGYFDLPSGTTAQRPVSPPSGATRFNSTTGVPEWYNPTTAAWVDFSSSSAYAIDYLIVAGGGGGGSNGAGGGGAGGAYFASTGVTTGSSLSVTVGAGGAGNGGGVGATGNSSVFNSVTMSGGGGGGSLQTSGVAGGSGGGGGSSYAGSGAGSGAAGTSGQGSAGGNGATGIPTVPAQIAGGGGGGYASAGAAGTNSNGGVGGTGLNWQSLGTFYAGGGGGGSGSTGGAGGSSVGGNGGSGGTAATNATANRGGGGGGGGNPATTGGNGASGVVIIRYLGTQRGSGGTVTTVGAYTYHTFTTSSTYVA